MWIEIDRAAIAENYKTFRSLIGSSVKLMAGVKSNAYGHDMWAFANEIQKLGADWLGVDSIVEALTLRSRGTTIPILVLGYVLPERLSEAAAHDISIPISNKEHLKALAQVKTSKPLKVHIKVDTGMHRQGFLLSEIPEVVSFLQSTQFKNIAVLEGLFTHFASAKNPSFPQYTKNQIAEFSQWKKAFEDVGFSFISHTAATAGAMLFPESHLDMVRIGIGLYGLWPSTEARAFLKDSITLKPILSWKTVVTEIKKVPKGAKIGYDSTETLVRDSLIAVCPVGYWHGYSRKLSSIARVLVRGNYCRVLGRVSMDMIVIDVTDVAGTKMGDEVVLIGKSGKGEITLADMASLDDTSYYETATRLNPLMKRIYR